MRPDLTSPCGRWVNLWWPTEIAEGMDEECLGYDIDYETGVSFPDNILLLLGILVALFVVHVVVVSAVEAKWVAKVRVIVRAAPRAPRRPTPGGSRFAPVPGALVSLPPTGPDSVGLRLTAAFLELARRHGLVDHSTATLLRVWVPAPCVASSTPVSSVHNLMEGCTFS